MATLSDLVEVWKVKNADRPDRDPLLEEILERLVKHTHHVEVENRKGDLLGETGSPR